MLAGRYILKHLIMISCPLPGHGPADGHVSVEAQGGHGERHASAGLADGDSAVDSEIADGGFRSM